MPGSHLVRIGVLGHVGRFQSIDALKHRRGARVICRTQRGLEVGEVLAMNEHYSATECDGTLLRCITVEDDLLLARLGQNREAAYLACVRKLAEHGIHEMLVDVEHLFDGQSIYFYFLGDVTPEVETITEELAEAYEAKVQFRRFTETTIAGCGPGCGTDATENGCGSLCSSCAIAGSCGR